MVFDGKQSASLDSSQGGFASFVTYWLIISGTERVGAGAGAAERAGEASRARPSNRESERPALRRLVARRRARCGAAPSEPFRNSSKMILPETGRWDTMILLDIE